MHKSISSGLIALALCSSALANDFYVGGVFKHQEFDSNAAKESEVDFKTLGLLAGYQINDFLAVETRAHFGVNGPEQKFGSGASFEQDIAYQIDALLKASYELTPGWSVYGFAGVSYTKLDMKNRFVDIDPNDNRSTLTDKESHNDTVATYGLGAQYQINKAWKVFAEYQAYGDFEVKNKGGTTDLDHNSFNVGVTYTF